MSFATYWQFVLALAAVLSLLALLAWAARRFGLAGRIAAPGGRRRLSIVEVAAVDGKRRLVLLRRDATEHLVLLGPDSATVIETGIARGPARDEFGALVREPAP